MRKLPWILGVMVALIALVVAGVVVGPALYKAARGGDDGPAATVTTDGAEAAVGDLDGSWSVIPGSEPNLTAAGYTVDEILRGEPVTVVGSTDEVSGRAQISGTTLDSAVFEVRVAGIATDSDQRDGQARSPRILDAEGHPVATLAVTEPVDLSAVPGDGTSATIPVPVDLTVKGRTVRASADVTVLRSGETLIASGSVPLTWTEVGVRPPSLGFVTVDADGTVDFLVNLRKD